MSNAPGKARIGGILSIISGFFGVLGLFFAVLMIILSRYMLGEGFMPYSPATPREFLALAAIVYGGAGIIFALIGTLGIIGGIFAIKKKHWIVALAGAIAGTITFYPLGIVAVIFVSLAQAEFALAKEIPQNPVPQPPLGSIQGNN
jgi:hypothetical protein